MGDRPHPASYLPPAPWQYGPDPITNLLSADELAAEIAEAIATRLVAGERHVHPKRGGCDTCASEAADTVARFLERNTRVIKSEALAPEEHDRARALMKSVPYLHSGFHLRCTGGLGADPKYPTVGDLLDDLAAIVAAVKQLSDREDARERELHRYRKWREAARDLANEVVDTFDRIDT